MNQVCDCDYALLSIKRKKKDLSGGWLETRLTVVRQRKQGGTWVWISVVEARDDEFWIRSFQNI